jgi:hypothetical protein
VDLQATAQEGAAPLLLVGAEDVGPVEQVVLQGHREVARGVDPAGDHLRDLRDRPGLEQLGALVGGDDRFVHETIEDLFETGAGTFWFAERVVTRR